ncbi:glycoside hydrolase family 16 protein [Daedalea quercina L-15889]|uniref:Glycoside hydrolase family 16 protein n=1 Tax=Daedalea quercina L-15889 TaxID=1314783 RepID=A0A165LMF0_9APHY|nr:glycoside hydrolase family 16 protein [Daedalea quercina L-15889]
MAAPQRRQPQQYYAVPQSPQNGSRYHSQAPTQSQSYSMPQPSTSGRNDTAHGVATGAIGGGYGPYSYNPNVAANGRYTSSRFSAAPSEVSIGTTGEKTSSATPMVGTATVQQYPYLWDTKDPELDDALHNPDPVRDAALERTCNPFSSRGWINISALIILVAALLTLFAGYPIIHYFTTEKPQKIGYNLGGINGSGQVPSLAIPSLIDDDTPEDARTFTSPDGTKYDLVFSDEFETPGRTFWPGDDAFWEAVDMNYWPTGDLEWYTPTQATTEDGKLVITMEEVENHNLNFRSAMLQTWNKFCFTTGYLEVKVSLPGSVDAPGFWPAVWTMGNLGHAGYGATTQGTWPYTYDSCDLGTFPNQTYQNGTPSVSEGLSYQPGQKLSACTCSGEDHPGPSTSVGRGVPEIDVFEAQVAAGWKGQVSQSMQVAPYNANYQFDESSNVTTIFDSSLTSFNTYLGAQYQQAVSGLTFINSSVYNNTEYNTYGFEWYSNPSDRDEGFVTWYSNEISNRLIPEEPMSIIINFGMSPGFQEQDWMHLQFPAKMYIDYVRVYQRPGTSDGTTCDPPNYPTADYINKHASAYTNPNYTTWAEAGYTWPKNSLYDGCS